MKRVLLYNPRGLEIEELEHEAEQMRDNMTKTVDTNVD